MAVSKRIRFEVLRRDNYTCRYCRSTDNPLTVDHVTPVALGGTDKPDNLVAACKDCNAGKSSASPDSSLVGDVSSDAVRWAAAMAEVARRAQVDRARRQKELLHFKGDIWDTWTTGDGSTCELAPNWESAVSDALDAGLTMDDLDHAVKVTMSKPWITDEFRYFMGVCKTMLMNRAEQARQMLTESSNQDDDEDTDDDPYWAPWTEGWDAAVAKYRTHDLYSRQLSLVVDGKPDDDWPF
jgi:HNH endonuclease